MKTFIALLALFISFHGYSQDTSKVEQYCEMVATARLLSNKVTINIDYGEAKSIWNDNRLREENGKVRKFNTIVDALNYLGKNGWKLLNAFPVPSANQTAEYHYIFKQIFLKTETGE